MKQKTMTLEKLSEQLGDFAQKVGQQFERIDQRFEQIDQRFEKIDQRFERLENRLDEEVRHLGVLMEDMDDKFTLMSEAQSVFQEVLETRVARIEEILEIRVA